MSLSPGRTLLHYRLVEKIGEGGMGEVWRATDTTLGRDVAVKSLPAAFVADPERMARFEREAKVLASLNHPAIAAIYGLHEADGVRFLAMEMVEGEDLSERLARGPLPASEALAVAKRIAEALEYAHEQGIVHRDLKPANVKLTADGGVKVLDFGLAKAIAGDAAARDTSSTPTVLPTMTSAGTAVGVILGTAAYMSPEQARGKAVDKRTDIWAFGCVVYECLTGKPLFEGETVSDLIAKVLQTEPDWSALPAATPSRIRALLARCLQKDAKQRLRDVGEARIALASPGEAVEEVPPPARPGGVPWWAAVVGALALAAVAVVATRECGSPTVAPPLRKLDMSAEGIDVDFAVAPLLSPDGARIAYVSKSQIWVRDLTRLDPRAVADVTSSTPIGWSPDSRTIVYGEGRKLWKAPAEGGRPTVICEIPGTGSIIGVAWSHTGEIAFSSWRGGLYRVAAAGGAPALMVDVDPATTVDFHAPSWLSNGELLYVTHWKSDKDADGRRRPALTLFDGKRQVAVDGDLGTDEAAPVQAPAGDLLFLRHGANRGIWSVGFDPKRHRVEGTPVLVAPDAVSVSVSEDGSLLYVEGASGDEMRELAWVDRSGKVIEALGTAHAGLDAPSLSPDGRRVAFDARDGGNRDVWVRDLARGVETRLTFDEAWETSPVWLASSSRIAYARIEDLQGRIISVNADGSGGQRDFAPAAGMNTTDSLSVAPDGHSAVRIVDERGHGRLRVGAVLPDGTLGALRPILRVSPEPDVGAASISPDGRLLAYTTNSPGQVDLFLTRYPSGEGQWQVSTDGGFRPHWAGNSGELFYTAGVGPNSRSMVVVKVDAGLDPPIGERTRLFDMGPNSPLAESSRFDVTPDGRRLLFTRPAGGAGGKPRRMVLVQNWRAELERPGGR